MRSVVLAGLVVLAGCEQQGTGEQSVATDQPAILSSPALTVSPNIHPSAPLVPPPPGSARKFQALGTEPFWSIDVLGSKLLYTSPDVPQAVAISASVASSGTQLRFSGTMEGKPVVLTIEPGACSDGMSDTAYAYKSSFSWGEQTEQGCARLK